MSNLYYGEENWMGNVEYEECTQMLALNKSVGIQLHHISFKVDCLPKYGSLYGV